MEQAGHAVSPKHLLADDKRIPPRDGGAVGHLPDLIQLVSPGLTPEQLIWRLVVL